MYLNCYCRYYIAQTFTLMYIYKHTYTRASTPPIHPPIHACLLLGQPRVVGQLASYLLDRLLPAGVPTSFDAYLMCVHTEVVPAATMPVRHLHI